MPDFDQDAILPAANCSRARVEEIARAVREYWDQHQGWSLQDLVRSVGGEVAYRAIGDWQLDDGTIRVRGPQDFVIQLPIETGALRDQFTIAHELGHYFVHSHQGERPGIRRRSLEADRGEWEANWFAAELLMPADEFRLAAQELDGNDARLAARFGVSTKAARVRRKSLLGGA